MVINFECKECSREFDCDVGSIELSNESPYPIFGSPIKCPRCGIRSIEGVELTEKGQMQMTEAVV